MGDKMYDFKTLLDRYWRYLRYNLPTNNQVVFVFENGYGASIIYVDGQNELAVLMQTDEYALNITYSTPIANCVLKGLDTNAIYYLLEDIKNLELLTS